MPKEPKELDEGASAAEKAKYEDDMAKYNRKKSIFVWYLNEWLPWVAGLEHWGPEIRVKKLPTDTMELVTGEDKVCVTCASEAFGLAVYDNCREKWAVGIPWMIKNNKTSIPEWKKKQPDTHQYFCRWTSEKTGARGGWSNDGIKAFCGYISKIQSFRETDEANGKPIQKLGREFIADALDVELDDHGEPAKKRQKTGSQSDQETPEEPFEITVLDE